MASDWVTVGSAGSDEGGHVGVLRNTVTGEVSMTCSRPEVRLGPVTAADVAQLLDRAAMPGQKELPRAAKCPRCGLPDGTAPVHGAAAKVCQHIWHQWRPQAEVEGRRADGGPPAGEARDG